MPVVAESADFLFGTIQTEVFPVQKGVSTYSCRFEPTSLHLLEVGVRT